MANDISIPVRIHEMYGITNTVQLGYKNDLPFVGRSDTLYVVGTNWVRYYVWKDNKYTEIYSNI